MATMNEARAQSGTGQPSLYHVKLVSCERKAAHCLNSTFRAYNAGIMYRRVTHTYIHLWLLGTEIEQR